MLQVETDLAEQQRRISDQVLFAGIIRASKELFPHEIVRGAPAQARLALKRHSSCNPSLI